MEVVATVTANHARCSLLFALSVVKTLKYPLSQEGIDRYIAAIATGKSDQADKKVLATSGSGNWPGRVILESRSFFS